MKMNLSKLLLLGLLLLPTKDLKSNEKDFYKNLSSSSKTESYNFYKEVNYKFDDYNSNRIDFFNSIVGVSPTFSNVSIPNKIDNSNTTRLNEILIGIKDDKINNYSELINSSKNFNEINKMYLGALFGKIIFDNIENNLIKNPLINNYENKELISRENLFYHVEDLIKGKEKDPIGLCKQIHLSIERLEEDLGINCDVVTNTGHAYNVMMSKEGLVLLNYNNLFISKSFNTEKVLNKYWYINKKVVFERKFYDKGEIKYINRTKNGEIFLDFISHKNKKDLEMVVNQGTYNNSIKYFNEGFFIKGGDVKGTEDSYLGKIEIIQAGYMNNFNKYGFSLDFEMDVLGGELFDKSGEGISKVYGLNYDINLNKSINNFEISLKHKSNYNILVSEDYYLLAEYNFTGGVSYKVDLDKMKIEPYSNLKYEFLKIRLDNGDTGMIKSENVYGINTSVNDDSLKLEYVNRMWENEVGIDLIKSIKDFEISASFKKSKSKYIFCPDKDLYKIQFAKKGDWNYGISFELDRKDYQGEVVNNKSFSLNISKDI